MPYEYGQLRAEDGPWRKSSGKRPPAKSAARKPVKPPPRKRGSFLWGLVKTTIALCVIAAGALAILVSYYASGLPATDKLFGVKGTPSITVLDVNGRMIATRGAGVGEIVTVAEMPPYLPQAVLAIEDRRFYDHFGLDVWGLGRALFANFEAGRVVQGGSTITQQLAKNLFLTPERTFERKMEEAILAFWLEMKFTKDEILTLYLNRVYFGAGTYGVEAAAQRYFNKSAREVTLKEAATLAGLLKAPSRFAPTKDAEAAEERAQIVLAAMVESGFITKAERVAASKTTAKVAISRVPEGAEYFADWVLEQVPGFIGGQPERDIVVETTLDIAMQRAAEKAVGEALEKNGTKMKIGQGAFVALATDGSVRAMVGGRAYSESQFNRAVQAQRGPGSAFKPFVFLAALEAGYRPGSLVLDAPIKLNQWSPENYKHKYEGEVTLTRALSHSLNSVAIRLIMDVGPSAAVQVANRMGILSRLKAQPALALGTSEVNLLELTSAYAPFANGGKAAIPHGIARIKTRDGTVLYQRSGSGPMEVIPAVFAAEMTFMMRETVVDGTAKRARLADRDAAGKTGTGQAFRDAWFIGYTRDMIAGAWVGNDDNSSMKNVTGGSVPADIWAAFMKAVADETEAGPLIALENNPDVDVAAGSGWYEEPGSSGGASEDMPVDGGIAETIPTDDAPMEVPEGEDFDRMFEENFGGDAAANDNEARRADRPGA